MKTYLAKTWEQLSMTFWLLPAVFSLAAAGAAALLIHLDWRLCGEGTAPASWLDAGSQESARSLLAAILGSIISVLTIAFSITIVALTMAASHLGPRLLRNFMRDRGNQAVLGVFTATFLYCLLVLYGTAAMNRTAALPHLSTAGGVALTVASLAMLVYFIHHVAEMIQAPMVILAVSKELELAVRRLYPQMHREPPEPRPLPPPPKDPKSLSSEKSDYIQAIDVAGLLELASRYDLLIRLPLRPGQFVSAGQTVATVEGQLTDELATKIVGCIYLGHQRTLTQDLELAVEELVEVAVRALSPSVNDPFTAMACLDRLASAFSHLAQRDFPSPCQFDSQGRLRLVVHQTDFGGVLAAGFDQIRQYGQTSVAVNIRMLEALRRIAESADGDEPRQAVASQGRMILDNARHFSQPQDVQDLRRRYSELMDALGRRNRPAA